jgi:hypothetical protein
MSTAFMRKSLLGESERLNRKQSAELTGIPYGSFCVMKAGDKKPTVEAIMRFYNTPDS